MAAGVAAWLQQRVAQLGVTDEDTVEYLCGIADDADAADPDSVVEAIDGVVAFLRDAVDAGADADAEAALESLAADMHQEVLKHAQGKCDDAQAHHAAADAPADLAGTTVGDSKAISTGGSPALLAEDVRNIDLGASLHGKSDLMARLPSMKRDVPMRSKAEQAQRDAILQQYGYQQTLVDVHGEPVFVDPNAGSGGSGGSGGNPAMVNTNAATVAAAQRASREAAKKAHADKVARDKELLQRQAAKKEKEKRRTAKHEKRRGAG